MTSSSPSRESLSPVIAFTGHWEHANRQLFPDRSGTPLGHILAVEAPGYGVLVGSSADPAFYLLTLGKRYQAQAVTFATVVVSAPCARSHVHARDIIYQLTQQRSHARVDEPLAIVRETMAAHLKGVAGGARYE